MSDQTPSLSPRHERFVAEYLKDGNATQAYIRAGYATRGAQPCASRLLRDPRIAAAIAAGRQRITEALAVSVERVSQEYAKIAYACVDDFVSTDADGRLRLDLEKAHKAQRAGIVELKFSNHSKQEQQVTVKLGKLQALAALNKQLGGQVAQSKAALEAVAETAAGTAGLRELLHTMDLLRQARARAERAEQALAESQVTLPATPTPAPDDRPPEEAREAAPPAVEACSAPATSQPHAEEGSMGHSGRAHCTPFETQAARAPQGEAGAVCGSPAEEPRALQPQSVQTPDTPTERRLPRSPQEANSVMELARWGTPAVPPVQPTCDADREYLLRSGQLSSYEAMKLLLKR